MEQYKNCSPRSPHAYVYAYAPASPRRHIHSSFPHYFYSTPAAPPSSDSISAFVALCESRLVAEDVDFAPTPAASSTVAPKGATVPVPPARPLNPPPRLQYIANIRKSLRNRISGLRRSSRGGGSRAPTKLNSNVARKDAADPFAAAAHKVTREDAPWCQLPWWRRNRKSKLARKAKAADDQDVKATAVSQSGEGMMNQAEVATSKNRKGSWIFRVLRSAIKAKEKEKKEKEISSSSSSDSKEEEEDHAGKNGQLVGLVRCTTASRRRGVLVRRRTRGRGSSRRSVQY